MEIFSAPVVGIFGIGMPEMLIVLVILLLLFGGSKLPSLAKGLGQSIKEFKTAAKDEPEEKDSKKSDSAPKPGNN